jgi:hypothetical protein
VLLFWRFYGTRYAVESSGEAKPHPNAGWEVVREVRAQIRRGRYTLPDFELELTGESGYRFYNPVMVDREGRETWHADNEIVLTPETVAALGGEVSVTGLLLYNLELKGIIAPGQLHD